MNEVLDTVERVGMAQRCAELAASGLLGVLMALAGCGLRNSERNGPVSKAEEDATTTHDAGHIVVAEDGTVTVDTAEEGPHKTASGGGYLVPGPDGTFRAESDEQGARRAAGHRGYYLVVDRDGTVTVGRNEEPRSGAPVSTRSVLVVDDSLGHETAALLGYSPDVIESRFSKAIRALETKMLESVSATPASPAVTAGELVDWRILYAAYEGSDGNMHELKNALGWATFEGAAYGDNEVVLDALALRNGSPIRVLQYSRAIDAQGAERRMIVLWFLLPELNINADEEAREFIEGLKQGRFGGQLQRGMMTK